MKEQSNRTRQIYIGIVAVLAWGALAVQFYLMLNNRVAPIPETLIRFFSYFTIQSNLLVAICASSFFLNPGSTLYRFFTKINTIAAITVYITIVGVVYNTILRFIWEPTGSQKVVDELLHLIIPILFILFWLFFVPNKRMEWKSIVPWMIYPVVYLIYVLIRGALSGFYPYPFLEVPKIGYSKTLINCFFIALLFFLFSLVFVWLARWKTNKPAGN